LVSGDGELAALDTLRRMPVFGDGKWKTWLVGVVFAIVIGFALRQYQSTFGPKLPDWIHLREHESERIPEAHGVNSAWRQFAELLRLTRAAAATQHVTDYTVMLTELSGDEHDATVWWGEPILNEGFDAMPNIERQFWSNPPILLGYYTDDATPLRFATRNNPHAGGDRLIVTVHLEKPIDHGASMFLIRRERRANSKAAKMGSERIFGLGNLRYRRNAVEARGVLLPSHVTLEKYVPDGPAIMIPESPIMVAWVSTDLRSNNVPLSVTFLPR
jgi:hypothetical protein